MSSKSMRSFRLSAETQEQITLIAADLGVNQTEALEITVQDFFLRLRSQEPEKTPTEAMKECESEEALARQWEEVADSFEADEGLSAGLKEAVARTARATAEGLRRG